MSTLIEKIRTEPALVVSLVVALLSLAGAFGLSVSDEQSGAIIGMVNAVLAIAGGVAIRSRVSPVDKTSDEELDSEFE